MFSPRVIILNMNEKYMGKKFESFLMIIVNSQFIGKGKYVLET